MARLYEKPLTLDIGHSRVLHFLSMSELACGRDNYLQALSFPFIYSNAQCTMVDGLSKLGTGKLIIEQIEGNCRDQMVCRDFTHGILKKIKIIYFTFPTSLPH